MHNTLSQKIVKLSKKNNPVFIQKSYQILLPERHFLLVYHKIERDNTEGTKKPIERPPSEIPKIYYYYSV